MGFFFQGYSLVSILTVVLVTISLIILNEITRRSKLGGSIFFGVLPVVLLVLIAMNVIQSPSSKTWFGVVKTFSALLGVWGFMIIRYTKAGETKFAFYFPVAILAINILEAVLRDIEVFTSFKSIGVDQAGLMLIGGPWNIMNAIAGIISIVTLTGWMGIKVAKTKSKDMIWPDQLWFWIIAYDLWNAAYCYNCISNRAMYAGLALLLSCTIAELCIKKGAWLQHRAQTLALFGMFSLAFDYQKVSAFSITSTNNTTALTLLSATALVVNLAVLGYEIFQIVKFKINPLKQEVYTQLKSYSANISVNNL